MLDWKKAYEFRVFVKKLDEKITYAKKKERVSREEICFVKSIWKLVFFQGRTFAAERSCKFFIFNFKQFFSGVCSIGVAYLFQNVVSSQTLSRNVSKKTRRQLISRYRQFLHFLSPKKKYLRGSMEIRNAPSAERGDRNETTATSANRGEEYFEPFCERYSR